MEEQVVSVGFEDVFDVVCPHCFTRVELYVDPTSVGSFCRGLRGLLQTLGGRRGTR